MSLLLLAALANILVYADILFYVDNFLLNDKGNPVLAHMCMPTDANVLYDSLSVWGKNHLP